MFAISHVSIFPTNECQLYFGTPSAVLGNMLAVNGLYGADMYSAPEEDQEKIYEIKNDISFGIE